MKIQELMTSKIVAVHQLEPISHAARLMKRHNLGVLPVCDEQGHLRGILTDRDIVTRCIAGDMSPDETKVREIMTRGLHTCSPQDDIHAALDAMSREQIRRLPIVDDGKLVGMVSLGDLARSGIHAMETAEAFTDISANIQHRE